MAPDDLHVGCNRTRPPKGKSSEPGRIRPQNLKDHSKDYIFSLVMVRTSTDDGDFSYFFRIGYGNLGEEVLVEYQVIHPQLSAVTLKTLTPAIIGKSKRL